MGARPRSLRQPRPRCSLPAAPTLLPAAGGSGAGLVPAGGPQQPSDEHAFLGLTLVLPLCCSVRPRMPERMGQAPGGRARSGGLPMQVAIPRDSCGPHFPAGCWLPTVLDASRSGVKLLACSAPLLVHPLPESKGFEQGLAYPRPRTIVGGPLTRAAVPARLPAPRRLLPSCSRRSRRRRCSASPCSLLPCPRTSTASPRSRCRGGKSRPVWLDYALPTAALLPVRSTHRRPPHWHPPLFPALPPPVPGAL